MMKILALALILPCILQISVCSPNQPQIARGMEAAESRGFLTSIKNFFGLGPRRSQSGAQKRERPRRPRPHGRNPNFPGPRPQQIYLPHGNVKVPQYEQPHDNHIQLNLRHEGFTEQEEEVGGQDSNYNIVSVNNVEFDPSEFSKPRPEDIIYNNNKPEQFQPVQPEFTQHHIREQHPNEGNIHGKGSVFWPEDREVHNNELNTNKHIGFSFPKPGDKVPSHISQSLEENKGISEFDVTNDANPNIINDHDTNNFGFSPKPFVESNSVKNSDDSSSLTSGPSDIFDGVFSNFFSSSLGFQRDTPSFTTKRPKVVFDLTTYVPPGFKRVSTTIRPHRFTLNGYSSPINYPTTTSSTTPSTTTANREPAPSRKPYFNIAPEMDKQKINQPNPISDLKNNNNNYEDDDDGDTSTNNNNNKDNKFSFQNVRKINSTSFSEQIWHLPTERPLTKSSSNKGQQKQYTIKKAVSLLESTIQYDNTTPTITTYKPRKVTQSISKAKRPNRVRVPPRYTTQRSTTASTTTTKPRATLPTSRPYIPPHGTPQRTHPPEIYKYIPKIVSHTTTPSPPPSTTTTSTTSTTTSSTTHRPKRNPDPRITPQTGWKQPQQYNIAVTDNTKYYSNKKPPIVDFNEDFHTSFDSFVPFRSSEDFFQTIFGAGNPLQQFPSNKKITTQPPFKSGVLVHQSSNSKNPKENQRQGSSEYSRPLAPFNKQPSSFPGLRGPSFPDGVTKYIVSSDTTERTSLQPQVKQHQNVQPQMRDHEAQRIRTSKPIQTQYIRRGTTSNQPMAPATELPRNSVTTNQEQDSQPLVFEGREQIYDDLYANKVSNYPTKTPTRTHSNKQAINTKNTVNAPKLQINNSNSQYIPKIETHIQDEPRYTQYIRGGTTSKQPMAPTTELPKKSVTTNQEQGSQPLVFEGREQINNDFYANKVSNYPTKTHSNKKAINTKNTVNAPQLQIDNSNSQYLPKIETHIQDEPESLHFVKPLITSWNSQQSSHHRSSPSPNIQLQTQRDYTPQIYERPQPTLPPAQYTTYKRDSSPYTKYQALAQTSPEPRPVSHAQTSSEFIRQPVPVTISPPQGVIIENQFSKEPTFHFGGGYHNWEDISSTSVASKDIVSTTAKPATTLAFNVNSPQSTTFSTSYEIPRSTKTTVTKSWVSLPTESTHSESYSDDVSDQGYVDNYQDKSEEEMEYQRGTTQFVYYDETTIPPRIQGEFERSNMKPENMRSPSNQDKSWGTKSETNGNIAPKTNEASPGNTFKRDEGEVPVILVRGSSRPPNNVWTPPTPPSATSATTRGPYRRRGPGSSRRPAPAVAPTGDLASVQGSPAVGANSNRRRQQTKGRDGLGWNSFPVPIMDLSVSSDMQEMMAQLGGGGSMDFMKLPSRGGKKSLSAPSRGDQKSLSAPSSGDSTIQIDYEEVGDDFPAIPEALVGALELNDDDNYSSQIIYETQEDINNANKESFKRSPTEKDIHQQTCDHGFCEEEFANTDDK